MKGLVSAMQPALDFDDLPEDTQARAELLELRTSPDPEKPSLSKECEARTAGVEEATAQCYAGMEDSTFRLRRLAKKIGDTVPTHRLASEAEG